MSCHLKTVFILSLLLLLVICKTCARPNVPGEYRLTNKHCSEDANVIEICQRCAKATKSPIVYPMCCGNEDDVFTWCDQYINFGRKP